MTAESGRWKAAGHRAVQTGGRWPGARQAALSAEHSALSGRRSAFSIQHSAFSIPPYAFAPRHGVTLLEVLVSIGILSIGLLSVAVLIPVGRFGIVEAGKADRAGACGHAALKEVKVRRMLDYRLWVPGATNPAWWAAVDNPGLYPGASYGSSSAKIPVLGAFAIDPLGVNRGLPVNLGGATSGSVVPRITLRSLATGQRMTDAEVERIFEWQDDLEFSLPENMEPKPDTESTRPWPADPSGIPQAMGRYTWLVTVTPAAAEAELPVADKATYTVSVVVCYGRQFLVDEASGLPDGEHTGFVKFPPGGDFGVALGGGSVELATPRLDPALRLRENEWIMLCGRVPDIRFTPPERTVCKWYRVVAADSGSPTTLVSLMGPDWDLRWCVDLDGDGTALEAPAVAIDHVIGVYTRTVELDRSLVWMQ